MRRFKHGKTPETEAIDHVVNKLASEYRVAAIKPLPWTENDIESVINHFMKEEVNLHASPGIPYARLGKTNSVILRDKALKAFIVEQVMYRLQLLATVDCCDLSAEERVKQGFCDPVRLFVKDEPHNREKINTGRLRLIMSVSLVDQLVERVLNFRLNQSEIRHWREIPSKGGSSMSKFEDRVVIASWMKNRQMAEADISGFDWSVKEWELKADAQLRIALSPGADERWQRALLQRVDCLSLSVFSLSDGRMIAQRTKGIQKSGSYNTTPSNSHIRVMLAYLAGAQEAIAVGDDGLEDFCSSAVTSYEALGHPLKMYERCYNAATFCSMYIKIDGSGDPLTWDKTFFRFLDSKVKDLSRLYQLCYVLGNSSHWWRISSWLKEHYHLFRWKEGTPEKIGEIIEGLIDDATQESSNKIIEAEESQLCFYSPEATSA